MQYSKEITRKQDAHTRTPGTGPSGTTGRGLAGWFAALAVLAAILFAGASAGAQPALAPELVKSNVLAQLIILRGQATIAGSQDQAWWDNAIAGMTTSLEPNRWVDTSHLVCGSLGSGVFDGEITTVTNLAALYFWNQSGTPQSTLDGLVINLRDADRQLAAVAIQDATTAGIDSSIIANAQANLNSGDQAATSGSPLGAMTYYEAAWALVCQAPVTGPTLYSTKSAVLTDLTALRNQATILGSQDLAWWTDAIAGLTTSLQANRWVDGNHIVCGSLGGGVFDGEIETVTNLAALFSFGQSGIPASSLDDLVRRLEQIDRQLAVVAITDATAAGASSTVIANAVANLDSGDQAATAGDPVGAITYYKAAWAATCGSPPPPVTVITVPGVYTIKTNVLAQLIALRNSSNLQQPFTQKFADAILHLQNSLSPAYWVDPENLSASGGDIVINEEKLAVNKLRGIMDSKKCPVNPAILQGFIDDLVRADRMLALISIENAGAAGLNAKKIAQDLKEVAKGDAEAAAGRYVNGIEHYRNAWRHALQLDLQVNGDAGAQMQFVANLSKSYVIQMSTDLVHWVPLGTCRAGADGIVRFADPAAARQPFRFIRLADPGTARQSFRFYRVIGQ